MVAEGEREIVTHAASLARNTAPERKGGDVEISFSRLFGGGLSTDCQPAPDVAHILPPLAEAKEVMTAQVRTPQLLLFPADSRHDSLFQTHHAAAPPIITCLCFSRFSFPKFETEMRGHLSDFSLHLSFRFEAADRRRQRRQQRFLLLAFCFSPLARSSPLRSNFGKDCN